MINKLKPILAQKQFEVTELYKSIAENSNSPLARVFRGEIEVHKNNIFKNALLSSYLAVIAEIKRKSPSKGLIAPINDVTELAERYISGGASALSILTDKTFFNGSIQDLSQVKNGINGSVPIIRKDFIIDEIQIAEALVAGADAILCIVAALGAKTKKLIEYARSLGLDVLVEIHDENELNIAIDSGADIIGINNRNLNTFTVDTNLSLQLVEKIPHSIIKVAESGITTPVMAREYYQAGFNAVLIGEALVRSEDPEKFIMECHNG
jgi:indole-3-glycerol phosphate synthase